MIKDDEEENDEKHLCWRCVGEDFLRAEIEKFGEIKRCDYCGRKGESFSIEELANRVETAFEQHYELTASEPSGLEYAMMKEGDYSWERGGEPVLYAICGAADIAEEPGQDVLSVLSERHYDIEMAQMGESGPFDDDAHYEEKAPDDIELHEEWRFFENSLKTETRFFSRGAEAILDRVFDGLAEHKQHDGKPVIVEAGPGTEIAALYRGRVFQSTKAVEQAIARPDLELGPPPFRNAVAGRMNPYGIAMFYGATDIQTVLGEVRPPAGSDVVVARFEILQPLKLLDVTALRTVYVSGSYFDPAFIGRRERAKFLQRVSDRIGMPVMPDDQPLDYLITQAIADYLTNRVEAPLDGIIYPSAQTPGAGMNVVLFHKSARVQEIEAPPGTTFEGSAYYHPEDFDVEYTAWEETPEEQPEAPAKPSWPPDFSQILQNSIRHRDDDLRKPTLRVDLPSVTVHAVQSVLVKTLATKVRRYRSPKTKTPPF